MRVWSGRRVFRARSSFNRRLKHRRRTTFGRRVGAPRTNDQATSCPSTLGRRVVFGLMNQRLKFAGTCAPLWTRAALPGSRSTASPEHNNSAQLPFQCEINPHYTWNAAKQGFA